MHQKKKLLFKVIIWVLFCTQVIGTSILQASASPELKSKTLSKSEKEFCLKANKLIDEEEYEVTIKLAEEYIKDDPNNAMYHQFKGLALVLDYADSYIPVFVRSKAPIEQAIKEFEISQKFDPENEDKALAAMVLAYVVSKQTDRANEIFEPAIKKYPQSIHLNYVGIKYYELTGSKSNSMVCKNFVSENNPEYNGKPVFAGVALVISMGTLIKILTTAIIVSYVAGFGSGAEI